MEIFSRIFSKSFIVLMIKFAIVGATGTVVNLLTLFILTEFFNVYYIVSEVFAFIFSVINNYILNKIWTFRENFQEKVLLKYFKFIIISLISLSVNLTILFILVEYFAMWYILAEVFAICCAFLINFGGNKLWTFRKNELGEDLGQI